MEDVYEMGMPRAMGEWSHRWIEPRPQLEALFTVRQTLIKDDLQLGLGRGGTYAQIFFNTAIWPDIFKYLCTVIFVYFYLTQIVLLLT